MWHRNLFRFNSLNNYRDLAIFVLWINGTYLYCIMPCDDLLSKRNNVRSCFSVGFDFYQITRPREGLGEAVDDEWRRF